MCENKRFHIEDLIEGVDFYWEEVDGVKLRVWTKEYLQMIRVRCCKNYCRHCPWEYNKKIDTDNGTSTKI